MNLEQPLYMRTCKLLAEFNIINILYDFDIFEVQRDKSNSKVQYIENKFLNGDFMAKSVFYAGRSSKCYLMYDKDTATPDAIKAGYDTYIVKQLDDKEIQELPQHIVLNLLLNTIKVGNRGKYRYNNITGKLLRVFESKNGVVKALKLNVDSNMCLFPQVETYTISTAKQIHDSKQIPFLFDANTGVFRKKTAKDKSNELYIKRSLSKKRKNTYPFFNYANPDAFFSSKLGYLYRLMNDVSRYIGDYVNLKFTHYEDHSQFINLEYENTLDYNHLADKIAVKGLNIVNHCNEEDSIKQVEHTINCIKDLYGYDFTIGDIDNKKFNIILIHNAEFYKKQKLEDPYDIEYGNCLVQHLIVDKKDVTAAQFKVILKELYIKEDVKSNRISITDWGKYGFDKPITFVLGTVDDITDDNEDDKSSTRKVVTISLMTVRPDGGFSIESYEPDNLFCTTTVPLDSQRTINAVFDSTKWLASDIELLVYEDISDIYIIRRTNEHTLPNLIEIGQRFETYKSSKKIKSEDIDNELHSFTEKSLSLYESEHLKGFTEKKEKLEDCIHRLTCENDKLSAGEIWEALSSVGLHKNIGQVFNVHLLLNQDFCISPQIKSHYFEKLYALQNFIGIHCVKTSELNACGIPSYSYFVGENKDRNEINGGGISNGCVIRQIFRNNLEMPEESFIRRILGLTQVNFVRLEQSSVLPFVAKYLKESVK